MLPSGLGLSGAGVAPRGKYLYLADLSMEQETNRCTEGKIIEVALMSKQNYSACKNQLLRMGAQSQSPWKDVVIQK